MGDRVMELAIEVHLEKRLGDIIQRVSEAEDSWKSERHERESAMMSLQQDMMALTDSVLRERELIERVFEDLEKIRSEQSQTLLKRIDDAIMDAGVQSSIHAKIIDECVERTCARLLSQQFQGTATFREHMQREQKEHLDSMIAGFGAHARIPSHPDTIPNLSIEAVGTDAQSIGSGETSRAGELYALAVPSSIGIQSTGFEPFEEKLESFREAMTSHISEVQALLRETVTDLHAECDDRRVCLGDLRESLNAAMAQSMHRIDLLESDLVNLDQKMRKSARFTNGFQESSPRRDFALSKELPTSVANSVDTTDSVAPLTNSSGLCASLLEAANVVADEVDGNAARETSQKLQFDLMKRAANANPGLSSILKRARELGEL